MYGTVPVANRCDSTGVFLSAKQSAFNRAKSSFGRQAYGLAIKVALVSTSIDTRAVIVLVGFDRIADAARRWPSATWPRANEGIRQQLKGGSRMSPMTEHDQSKKFAEKSAATANKAFATVEQSARAVEQSYSVSLENIRAFNLKMIDMARANVEAVLDLSQQIATAKAPSDVVELWTTHAHKQFEMLSEQSKELAALAHKMAGESAETMTRSVNQVFQKAS
jgi:hypothetical protein